MLKNNGHSSTILKNPERIAVILDGNRRFAKRLLKNPYKGHDWGAKKVEMLFDWCKEYKIKELTLYAFSLENNNRPKNEKDYLFKLFKKGFKKMIKDKRIKDNGIRIRFVGRINLFPKDIQELMNKIMEMTKKNKNYNINFAMCYGGRAEIVDATRKIAEKVKKGELSPGEIDEDTIQKNLYEGVHDPDLIIRTGGEKRTSNFLNFQSAYSEWIFIDKMWPEFDKRDFANCIEEFKSRQRRFGR